MQVAIIKYNAGNIHSVDSALKRIGVEALITDDKELLMKADKVIFPGVGEARSTMEHLKATRLDQVIRDFVQPVLGICIGMQLMCSYSEEGEVECLGIFDVPVKKFIADNYQEKIPHMGWNQLHDLKPPLFNPEMEAEFVYFVHSFYVPVNSYTSAVSDYIQPFSAAMQRDNYFATQFHVEKSGSVGERILRNFLEM